MRKNEIVIQSQVCSMNTETDATWSDFKQLTGFDDCDSESLFLAFDDGQLKFVMLESSIAAILCFLPSHNDVLFVYCFCDIENLVRIDQPQRKIFLEFH